ncbi:sulfurtransferase [Novosphingobium sp. KN65.2]|uniref:sulfurtransferase n=1 Tax=Novosphingobium sp. KN65.2 TaxID=1478134 RepID=UPI0005E6F7EE|nr:sulfurtransferase [Novosphingobium sp. KN65.2]CDO37423.1 putative 3-mercaptopyruvate sulfurtransferase [Novosphingobium sp. KN65.2]
MNHKMPFETLISVTDLQALLESGTPVLLLDCEFDLAAPEKGRAVHAEGHLPGARYAHLDNDLASAPNGANGRHPLPDRDTFAAWLRSLGLRKGQQVIAYDSNGGAWAARAWWLLRWMGHRAVAVLDGGKPAWVADGHDLTSEVPEAVNEGDFAPGDPLVGGIVSAQDVLGNIRAGAAQVLDARDPSRFRGDANPLDPVAGHMPGARNHFFRDNLDGVGRFRSAEELSATFSALLDGKPAVLSCGSGVTACHNALAMEIAGLPGARLYPGSWSEWISDPARPVETGEA